MATLPETILQFLRQAVRVAQRARDNGNHPFGAVLVDENGVALFKDEKTINLYSFMPDSPHRFPVGCRQIL